jgi:signal peptidase I
MNLKHLTGVLILAILLALVIRTFIFETIRIATPAMTENQEIGNRLIVEKWSVGSRLPMTLGIPFVPETLFGMRTYIRLTDNYIRLPGFSKIKRNDLLEFNCPAETDKPIDKLPVLLSRCVGLPGEYVSLKGTELFINDKKIQRHPDVSICYRYPIKLQKEVVRKLNLEQINRATYQEKDSGFIYLTKYQYFTLIKKGRLGIDLKPCTFSYDERSAVIPFKGFYIKMDSYSYHVWGNLINRFEGIHLEPTADGHFKENGKEIDHYTFKQNYYWLLNDHQGYLNDSRSFGLIPESYIIGKVCLVFFSPKNKRFLQKI